MKPCAAACLLPALWAVGGADLAAESVPLGQIIAPEVEEIEVVYVPERAPQVTLKGRVLQATVPSLRLREPTISLLGRLGGPRAFGGCEGRTSGKALIVNRAAGLRTPCGVVLPLLADTAPIDALSYTHLSVRGEATGSARLALIDETMARREGNVVIADLRGRFDQRFSLRDGGRVLDLRRLTGFVVLVEANETTVRLDALSLERRPQERRKHPRVGFWVWRYRDALRQGRQLLDTCKRYGCGRLLVQMPSLEDPAGVWAGYARFFKLANELGIDAWALDGEPQAIHNPRPIIEKLKKLRMTSMGQDAFGLQLDIEPYLLEDFVADASGYLRYLAAIDAIKGALPQGARLSVVMPFWFVSQSVHGRPLAFEVMDRVDEIAVMSYRTDLDELGAIAEDTLRYGDLIGSPVWLSLETTALPVERHVVLKQEQQREFADAYLDRENRRLVFAPPPTGAFPKKDWFRVHHRVTVNPERLTFADQRRNNVQQAVNTLFERLRNPSLAGVLIHDLDGFLALPE